LSFHWFQRLIISIVFGLVTTPLGIEYVNVTETTLFVVAFSICFGVGLINEKWARYFFFLLTMIAVLVPISKIFRVLLDWSDPKAYIVTFAVFVPIMFIKTKWNMNVLNRVIIASGIALEICIYFTKFVTYTPVEMFVAWMPLVYFIFQPRLLIFLFIFLLNFLTGQFILDHLEIKWLIPATAGVVLVLSTILNLVIKPKPSMRRGSWSYSGGGGGSSSNDVLVDFFPHTPREEDTYDPRDNRPSTYYDADWRQQIDWDNGLYQNDSLFDMDYYDSKRREDED
jgi:hypothetical protein